MQCKYHNTNIFTFFHRYIFVHIWIFIALLLLIPSLQSHAQLSADPNNEIYKHIDKWVGRGYVTQLPAFRPLPLTVLQDILETVIKVGSFRDRIIAQQFLTRVDTTIVENNTYGIFNTAPNNDNNTGYGTLLKGGSLFSASSFLTPLISISASFGLNATYTSKFSQKDKVLFSKPFIHPYVSILDDSPDDGIKFQNVLGGATIAAAWASRSSFTVGKKDLFVQTGIMQRSIGLSHDDGLIVSPVAKYSPNAIVFWRLKHVSFTWAFFALSARQQFKEFSVDERGFINYSRSTSDRLGKYFFYNAVNWYVNPNIELFVFESVMFGTFNFSYLLPFKYMYAVDSLGDFAEGNLMIGGGIKLRLNNTLTFPTTIVVDDFDPIAFVQGSLNSAKKIALETGVDWYPISLFLKNISFKYQIIGSYTFSHGAVGDAYTVHAVGFNYTNHTHYSRHFGSTMPPSSHRFTINTTITPLSFLELTFFMRFMQHNNPSVGFLNGPLNDGSIYDDGQYSAFDGPTDNINAYKKRGSLDFLTGTIENTFYVGSIIDILDIQLTKYLALYGNLHYEFRYTINKNLIDNNNEQRHEVSGLLGLRIKLY